MFDFQELLNILYAPFMWILNGAIYVLGYTTFYIFDGFLLCITALISLLDFSTFVFDFISRLADLPPQLQYLLCAVGFPQALAIISGAYLARMLLNLIPAAFTRI